MNSPGFKLRAPSETEERYRSLFVSMDAGFCVIEMIYDQGRPVDYRFLEVNPAFERQTGLTNAASKTMREHAPGHEQHWFDIYARVAETGVPARFVEEAKALSRWYEVSAFRAGAAGSGHVGILFNDISERVRAEQMVRESTRRKDEFLATLAHELRNPLAPIGNAVSILRLREGHDDELRLAADVIDRQVKHLVRLVDDLLDVSRITFGKVRLKRTRVDLREVAREAAAASRPQMDAARQRLRVVLAEQPVWIEGDPVRLAQVVGNLLNNAARYTPQGGGVALEVRVEGGEARVTVEDDGVGIEPGMLERIFEPFVQIERRDSPGVGGIGIGLALARALVQLHGGRIAAQSEGAGRGSRFEVSLPLAAAPQGQAAESAAEPGGARRFLVVDDNVDATITQAMLLRRLGHEVETAYDGAAALEKTRAFRPDIVLLDLGMPGMDGFEVARRLREMPEGRGVFLVAQTGWGQDEDRRRTRQAGFDAHLAKPVDLATLLRLV